MIIVHCTSKIMEAREITRKLRVSIFSTSIILEPVDTGLSFFSNLSTIPSEGEGAPKVFFQPHPGHMHYATIVWSAIQKQLCHQIWRLCDGCAVNYGDSLKYDDSTKMLFDQNHYIGSYYDNWVNTTTPQSCSKKRIRKETGQSSYVNVSICWPRACMSLIYSLLVLGL